MSNEALYIVIALLAAFASLMAYMLFTKKAPEDNQPITDTTDPFALYLGNAVCGAVVLDASLKIAQINTVLCEHLGLTQAAVIGTPFSKHIASADQAIWQELTAHSDASGSTAQIALLAANNKQIQGKLSLQAIPANQELLVTFENQHQLLQYATEIEYRKTHDELTGLNNRKALEAYLNKTFESQSLFSKPIAMIYINVDQLKVVNDTCGHIAGDELLKQLVHILKNTDVTYDYLARVGGDEFALIKEDATIEQAEEVAEIIRSTVEDISFSWDDKNFRQSLSIGVALSSPRLCTITEIIGAADAACEQAKVAGKNRVHVHKDTRAASEDSRHQMRWVSRIQQAFIEDRFELFFQPIVALHHSDQYVHYELLIRYRDENNRFVSPNAFLPAAEKYGLSTQIDLWVLTTALDFLASNPEHTYKLQCCSINLSAHSLSSHQTRSAIAQLIIGCGFPPEKVCFEITETSAIKNLDEATAFIEEMKLIGCRFALDDFGTGFSSLGYLKSLNVDYLKIDGAFIRNIVHDKIDHAMVTAVASIGKEMHIATIAEFVENEEIKSTLSQMAVDYGQGFGFAKPMPLNDAVAYYNK
ncbi:EAL domain-containing protein [Saccharophagus degradans]|uniref:EAL domain-containing protein n=1 Tax=Saccharophagus degradans TaxID=86304 RepID=UPI001C0881F9|nr:EAL domain-containing protein [Saccharophagus degradans]MBU2984369.1 EAL domain-containing protein [Saccharophagus degradans]